MLNLRLSAIAALCQGQLQGAEQTIHRIVIDSRAVVVGDLFVALAGEHSDGHDYVAAALANGALAAIVERPMDIAISQIIVADAVKALAVIASAQRAHYQGTVIAITGSSGKTSTRHMLSQILAQAGSVSATQGNFNNDLGLPLTIFNADLNADYWALEMGAAQAGDIARLMHIAKPTISVITNVGSAHIGRFGSVDSIANAKAEIYRYLDNTATAVINLDDAFASRWQEAFKGKKLSYSLSEKNADVYASALALTAQGSCFILHYQGQSSSVQLAIAGQHAIQNAVCAASCALAAGVSLHCICQALADVHTVAGRLEEKQGINGARLIDDSYNANPSSVKAAIDVLAMQSGRRILVLGDMAELGAQVSDYHAEVGRYAKEKAIDYVLTCGTASEQACQAFGRNGQHFKQQTALIDYLQSIVQTNDVLLIKGSRSSAMDVVVEQLEKKATASCC